MQQTAQARISISNNPVSQPYRLNSIDLLRGLVMIIMALDHTRDFVHEGTFTGDPLNLQTTTPALFFTRWITHFCAPVFVFLAGTSIYLQGVRKSKRELSFFLFTRGLWLVLVEVFVMALIFSFDPAYPNIFLQVIWAIGISMMLLSILVWIPYPALVALGFLIVFGHNALDLVEKDLQPAATWYRLLHQPSYPLLTWKGHNVMLLYPFLPWCGVMILGYGLGKLFVPKVDPSRRARNLLLTGVALIVLFIILRWTNAYGDPLPWSPQQNAGYTFMSFINTQKYPPSLLFLCMIIGPALLFLAAAGRSEGRLSRIITVYGRVPFFYYVAHFFLVHIIAMIIFFVKGYSVEKGLTASSGGSPFNFVIPGEGLPLWGTYLVWIGVVVALYPACRWFGRYKQRHKKWWLSYL